MKRARSPRRIVFALALLLGALPGSVALGQASDEPVPPSVVVPSQDGWWNRAAGPQEAEPANPLRPVIGGMVPAPSTVPADGLAVGAVLGDADKVAAVGFLLEAPIDALVDRLTLTLKESSAQGANTNAAGATVVACPIVDFWAGVKNGDFVNRPRCDESMSTPGVRAANGAWSFDLTSFATAWLDPASGLAQNGVLLREDVAAPVSFQVSYGDLSTGTIAFDFATTGGGFSASSEFTFEETAPDATVEDVAPTEEFATTDTGSSTFDSGSSSFGSSGSTSGATTARPTASRPVPAVATVPVAQAVPASGTSRVLTPVGLLDALPLAALLFLVLLVAGGAVFLGLVLGPLATPTPSAVRSGGGVSRALAARSASNPPAR